jgi:U3 small nucleolar RNA-associated protein 10
LQWKPLVSALMLHGRSQSAAVRRAAVYVFEQLFVSIGDNLLVILPELLPWISELLEDGDVGVERNVQKLVKIIEKLSGESLDATLQG